MNVRNFGIVIIFAVDICQNQIKYFFQNFRRRFSLNDFRSCMIQEGFQWRFFQNDPHYLFYFAGNQTGSIIQTGDIPAQKIKCLPNMLLTKFYPVVFFRSMIKCGSSIRRARSERLSARLSISIRSAASVRRTSSKARLYSIL